MKPHLERGFSVKRVGTEYEIAWYLPRSSGFNMSGIVVGGIFRCSILRACNQYV